MQKRVLEELKNSSVKGEFTIVIKIEESKREKVNKYACIFQSKIFLNSNNKRQFLYVLMFAY